MAAEAFSFPALHAPSSAAAHPRLSHDVPMMAVLQRMSGETGQPPMRLMRDFAGLSLGPGHVSFSDYTRLRLYDEEFWEGVDRRTVVGARRAHELARRINHRHDWHGLASNKVAASAYLAAFGFPVVPSLAIYAHDVVAPAAAVIRTRGELRGFLAERAPYPLVGKPVEGGLGAVGLAGWDGVEGGLRTLDGRRMSLDAFVERVAENHAAGYLFQRLVEPHPAVAEVCGGRLGTVRLVTLATDHGPKLFRAAWKIAAGSNFADSPGLAGNLVAELDPRAGVVKRVSRGQGFDIETVTRHPETGGGLLGAQVPGWEAMKAVAIEAARLLKPMPLIGWDLAPTPTGPMIMQMDAAPDLAMHQLVERRGALGPDLADVLAEQRRVAAERADLLRAELSAL